MDKEQNNSNNNDKQIAKILQDLEEQYFKIGSYTNVTPEDESLTTDNIIAQSFNEREYKNVIQNVIKTYSNNIIIILYQYIKAQKNFSKFKKEILKEANEKNQEVIKVLIDKALQANSQIDAVDIRFYDSIIGLLNTGAVGQFNAFMFLSEFLEIIIEVGIDPLLILLNPILPHLVNIETISKLTQTSNIEFLDTYLIIHNTPYDQVLVSLIKHEYSNVLGIIDTVGITSDDMVQILNYAIIFNNREAVAKIINKIIEHISVTNRNNEVIDMFYQDFIYSTQTALMRGNPAICKEFLRIGIWSNLRMEEQAKLLRLMIIRSGSNTRKILLKELYENGLLSAELFVNTLNTIKHNEFNEDNKEIEKFIKIFKDYHEFFVESFLTQEMNNEYNYLTLLIGLMKLVTSMNNKVQIIHKKYEEILKLINKSKYSLATVYKIGFMKEFNNLMNAETDKRQAVIALAEQPIKQVASSHKESKNKNKRNKKNSPKKHLPIQMNNLVDEASVASEEEIELNDNNEDNQVISSSSTDAEAAKRQTVIAPVVQEIKQVSASNKKSKNKNKDTSPQSNNLVKEEISVVSEEGEELNNNDNWIEVRKLNKKEKVNKPKTIQKAFKKNPEVRTSQVSEVKKDVITNNPTVNIELKKAINIVSNKPLNNQVAAIMGYVDDNKQKSNNVISASVAKTSVTTNPTNNIELEAKKEEGSAFESFNEMDVPVSSNSIEVVQMIKSFKLGNFEYNSYFYKHKTNGGFIYCLTYINTYDAHLIVVYFDTNDNKIIASFKAADYEQLPKETVYTHKFLAMHDKGCNKDYYKIIVNIPDADKDFIYNIDPNDNVIFTSTVQDSKQISSTEQQSSSSSNSNNDSKNSNYSDKITSEKISLKENAIEEKTIKFETKLEFISPENEDKEEYENSIKEINQKLEDQYHVQIQKYNYTDQIEEKVFDNQFTLPSNIIIGDVLNQVSVNFNNIEEFFPQVPLMAF
ncbi:MAG: hypothetical protein AABY27_06565 [Pseudomonadota bacterium]